MPEYIRPENGFYFDYGGTVTRDVPDALPHGKYAGLLNTRSTSAHAIRTRPGYDPLFSCNNAGVTDIRAYTRFNNDSQPRFLARDANGQIWLDNNNSVGNLSGNAGYGAAMIPWRPAESALSWMYIAGLGDYQKFSAPDANNNVMQAKVGIAEPQIEVEAAPEDPNLLVIGQNNNWTLAGNNNGTVAAANKSGSGGPVGTVAYADPVWPTRFSLAGSNLIQHQPFELLYFNNSLYARVEDVIPPVPLTAVTGAYNEGNANWSLALAQQPFEQSGTDPLAGLRRGALVNLSANNNNLQEEAFVLDVIPGPQGALAVEVQRAGNGNWTPTQMTGYSTLVVYGDFNNLNSANGWVAPAFNATFNTGISTASYNFGTNPWAGVNNNAFTQDDYISIQFFLGDPTKLIQILLLFALPSSQFLYYAVRPGDLNQVLSGNQTQLTTILTAAENEIIGNLPTPDNIAAPQPLASGNSQWSTVMFPISALQRIGGDLSRTLADCNNMQIQINLSGNTSVWWTPLWTVAGKPPDVGANGSPYFYQCVPLNSNTGVRGNPTPPMKYGVSPRRQSVLVKTSALNNAYDSQIDTWEVNRQGGSVDTMRYCGSVAVGSDFTDVNFDDAVKAGNLVVIDNTEPWPTVDKPWNFATGGAGSNNITAIGQYLQVTSSLPFPSTMNRWLPGTLFQIGGQEAHTLRSRPTSSNNNTQWLFEFEECIGTGNPSPVFVLEPNVAREILPYVWGPDEYGFMFGAGDPLRPGVVSYAKPYSPDAVPTAYNLEICPPSEPLLGGEVMRGVSYVASSKRWWSLNFQSGNQEQQFVPVAVNIGKRLAAPYGHISDGDVIYFWGLDGIYMTGGGPAESLTDDILNLFPHAGTKGLDIIRGPVTLYAPDYSRAATFRLGLKSGELFASYQDCNGNPRMLVCQLSTRAWSVDVYRDPVTVAYGVEQPKGSLTGAPASYADLVLGDKNGKVWVARDATNDGGNNNGSGIAAAVYTREFPASDLRSAEYWGDMYLDCIAPYGANATPVTQGNAVAAPTAIAANNNRQFSPVSVGGETLQSFLGAIINWTDNYS